MRSSLRSPDLGHSVLAHTDQAVPQGVGGEVHHAPQVPVQHVSVLHLPVGAGGRRRRPPECEDVSPRRAQEDGGQMAGHRHAGQAAGPVPAGRDLSLQLSQQTHFKILNKLFASFSTNSLQVSQQTPSRFSTNSIKILYKLFESFSTNSLQVFQLIPSKFLNKLMSQ